MKQKLTFNELLNAPALTCRNDNKTPKIEEKLISFYFGVYCRHLITIYDKTAVFELEINKEDKKIIFEVYVDINNFINYLKTGGKFNDVFLLDWAIIDNAIKKLINETIKDEKKTKKENLQELKNDLLNLYKFKKSVFINTTKEKIKNKPLSDDVLLALECL